MSTLATSLKSSWKTPTNDPPPPPHPAKRWFARLFWNDHSNQSVSYQVLDLLHDIRGLLFFIALVLILK